MSNRVLVLNSDCTPLTVCSVERAFVLVFLNKSEVIRSLENRWLHSISQAYAYPSVIRLFRYIRAPYRTITLTRQNIFKRDNYICQYCGTHTDLTLDHILPTSRGGLHTWLNLVTACKKCNLKKGDQTPSEASMKLIKQPTKPNYTTLFFKNYPYPYEWADFLIHRK